MSKMKRAAETGEAGPEIFHGDRRKLTADFVARFEKLLGEQQDLAEDLKALAGEAKAKRFSKPVVKAMRKIAKLRLDDKRREASSQLEALHQVADACDFDLFEWQRSSGGEPRSAQAPAAPGFGSPSVN